MVKWLFILKQLHHQNVISRDLTADVPVVDNSTEKSIDYLQLLTKVHTIIN